MSNDDENNVIGKYEKIRRYIQASYVSNIVHTKVGYTVYALSSGH